MAFTPEQVARIEAALAERVGRGRLACVMCHQSPLTLTSPYVALTLVSGDPGYLWGGPILQEIGVICPNCGFTHLFNAKALGLGDLGVISLDPAKP